MLNKLLKRYHAYRKNREEEKDINQKLANLTNPVFLDRAVKGMRR